MKYLRQLNYTEKRFSHGFEGSALTCGDPIGLVPVEDASTGPKGRERVGVAKFRPCHSLPEESPAPILGTKDKFTHSLMRHGSHALVHAPCGQGLGLVPG